MNGPPSLNFDILDHVMRWCTPDTLLTVAQASRAARKSACPWLYQHVLVNLDQPAHAQALLLTLINEPVFSLRTRSFRVIGHSAYDEQSVLLQLIRLVLQQMPHLEVLDMANYLDFLASVDPDRSMINALFSLSSLVELHFRPSQSLDELLPSLPALQRISIQLPTTPDSDSLRETCALLDRSRPVLTALEVFMGDLSPLFTDGGAEPWSAVTILSVDAFPLHLASLLPNVTHLRLLGFLDPHLLLDPDVLPSLKALYLSDSSGLHAIQNNENPRRLQHLTLENSLSNNFHIVRRALDGAALTSLHIYREWPHLDAFVVFGQFLTRIAESFPNLRRLTLTFFASGRRGDDRSSLLHALVGPRGATHRALRVLQVRTHKHVMFTSLEQLRLQRAVENTFPELTFAELMFGSHVTHWAWYRVLHRGHSFRHPTSQQSAWDWVDDVGDPTLTPCKECRDFQKNAPLLNAHAE